MKNNTAYIRALLAGQCGAFGKLTRNAAGDAEYIQRGPAMLAEKISQFVTGRQKPAAKRPH